MSRNYDNWEKLVGAVLKREQLRKLALSHSITSCSSISDDVVSSCFSCRFDNHHQLVVCKGHKAQSDSFEASIWEKFLLPQDHHPRFIGLLQGTNVVFVLLSLTLAPLKKVVFLSVEAREFTILTEDSPEGNLPYSFRFHDAAEVVQVASVSPLDIRGKIRTRLLTPKTIYGVYLVFEFYNSIGYERAKAVIRFVDDETDDDAERRGSIVHLYPVDERETEREGETAVGRGDGWKEVEIGSFYVDDGDEGEVEALVVLEKSYRRKGGLIIEGFEFRPLLNVKQLSTQHHLEL